jgi:uncharacterized protein (TIGR02594 family)
MIGELVMATKSIKEIQTALIAAGYDIGPNGADGDFGRDTIAGLKAFQRAKGLQGLGVVGPRTLALLFPGEKEQIEAVPAWYANLFAKRGLHEALDNKELREYLKSDKQALGDPSKLPWCGDAVQTAIALTLPDEIIPANPYWAQNWQKFGVAMEEPALGAILVFVREGGGHVGFYAGEDEKNYFVLGGNQKNSVSIAPVAKKQCIAVRWPRTVPLPRSGRIMMQSAAEALDNRAMG